MSILQFPEFWEGNEESHYADIVRNVEGLKRFFACVVGVAYVWRRGRCDRYWQEGCVILIILTGKGEGASFLVRGKDVAFLSS